MRFIIDGHAALQSSSSLRGIGRYGRGLLAGLANIDHPHDILLSLCAVDFEDSVRVREEFCDLIEPERIIIQRGFPNVRWDRPDNVWRRRANEVMRNHFHAAHKPDAVLTLSSVEGFQEDVVSPCQDENRAYIDARIVYDLIPLLNPETYPFKGAIKSWYDEKIESLSSSDLLLGISDFATQEAIRHISRSPEYTHSISTGCDSFFTRIQSDDPSISSVKSRLGIEKHFFFSLGSFEPRKNFDTLIDAYALLPVDVRARYQLVLGTEVPAADLTKVKRIISSLSLQEDDVLISGRLDDSELRALYNICHAFVFPSLHEGFGLPPLEAMQCGAAVIGSNRTSVPEVLQDLDAMFDPQSANEMADLMTRLIEDTEFQQKLKQNAKARISAFSWERTAQKAIENLEKACTKTESDRPSKRHPSRSLNYRRLISNLSQITRKTPSPSVDELAELANLIAHNHNEQNAIWSRPKLEEFSNTLHWRIEGPVDSNYSLALLNRETFRALRELKEPSYLHCTEGPGDYEPNLQFLEEYHPDIHRALSSTAPNIRGDQIQIVSRNLYPPRVSDMAGDFNLLHHYAWEESLFPQEWTDQFNLHLDGLTCLSNHVRKALQDSGVIVPMVTSGCGFDHWETIVANPEIQVPGKKYKFLHISSCFPRKGVDVLLQAFGQAFTRDDDVSLIIKTFENPHNNVQSQIENLKAENADFPDVQIILRDWPDEDLKSLYQQCNAFVGPSRAEGAGMPFAEAMLSGLPVIATGWSGQLDFCNKDTAWLIDFDFDYAQSHFGAHASVWAEPRIDDLVKLMRQVHAATPKQIERKTRNANQLLLSNFRWIYVAERLTDAAETMLDPKPQPASPKVGWMTTWNTKCGIATYSKNFLKGFPGEPTIFAPFNEELLEEDGEQVIRSWKKGRETTSLSYLEKKIYDQGIDALVIQLNYGFLDFEALGLFIRELSRNSISVYLELHSTSDPLDADANRLESLVDGMRSCARVLVHAVADMNRLKKLGVISNLTLFPHGIVDGPQINFTPHSETEFVISSYGFCLPHKGLEELIEAFGELHKADNSLRLHLVNALFPEPFSDNLHRHLQQKAQNLGLSDKIRFMPDFLPDEESLALLRQSDLVVFPYQNTAESASGAVRFGISSGRPVATTPLPIFRDVEPATFRLPGTSVAELASGLSDIITALQSNQEVAQERRDQTERWRQSHLYRALGGRLHNIIRSIHHDAARMPTMRE